MPRENLYPVGCKAFREIAPHIPVTQRAPAAQAMVKPSRAGTRILLLTCSLGLAIPEREGELIDGCACKTGF